MPEQQITTTVRVAPNQPGPPDKTWEDGVAGPSLHPAVQRRTFFSEHGVVGPQWGIRDSHGTWTPYPDRLSALLAAFGEYAT